MSLLFVVPALAGKKNSETYKNEITIGTFNVENLFDTEHDKDKGDWEFLPMSFPGKEEGCKASGKQHLSQCLEIDWTPAKLQLKLQQIKKLLTSAGPLPDILGVAEVENIKVLQMLAKEVGYSHAILEEGGDMRGIDVGLMYNDDKVEYVSHVSRSLERPTRDILTVYFKLKGASGSPLLAVYVNHWPSQANSPKDRVNAAEHLRKFIDEDVKKYGSSLHVVALGDFNTIDSDWPHPFKQVLLDSDWTNVMTDVVETALTLPETKKTLPLGTYFFPPKMQWSYLDHIFASKNLSGSRDVELAAETMKVINTVNTRNFEYRKPELPLFGSVVTGVPIRYDHNASTAEEAGYSDHLPLTVKLRWN